MRCAEVASCSRYGSRRPPVDASPVRGRRATRPVMAPVGRRGHERGQGRDVGRRCAHRRAGSPAGACDTCAACHRWRSILDQRSGPVERAPFPHVRVLRHAAAVQARGDAPAGEGRRRSGRSDHRPGAGSNSAAQDNRRSDRWRWTGTVDCATPWSGTMASQRCTRQTPPGVCLAPRTCGLRTRCRPFLAVSTRRAGSAAA